MAHPVAAASVAVHDDTTLGHGHYDTGAAIRDRDRPSTIDTQGQENL
jgi:hypothetical protein